MNIIYIVRLDWHDSFDSPIGIFTSAQKLKDAMPAITKEYELNKLHITRNSTDTLKPEVAVLGPTALNYTNLLDAFIEEEKTH